MATTKTAEKPPKEKPNQPPPQKKQSLDTPVRRPSKPATPPVPAPQAPLAASVADGPAAPAQAPAQAPMGVRMPAINDVRLAGRLTRDPIIRDVGTQKVANFDIAVEKLYRDAQNKWQKQVSYVPCAVWGAVADRASGFLKKGSPVYLEGRLRSQSWQTRDGQKRSIMRLEAFKVQSLARGQNKTQGQEVGE